MMTRLIDFLKTRGTTALFTSLTKSDRDLEQSEVGISSLIDTWLMLEIIRSGGERNRTLTIIKSRGMPHSNQATEYRLGSRGIELVDPYLGATGVLTGSARLTKEADDRSTAHALAEEIARLQEERARRNRILERRISALREECAGADAALEHALKEEVRRRDRLLAERETMGRSRQAFAAKRALQGRRARNGQ
jgi:circadian clock protein KaiC